MQKIAWCSFPVWLMVAATVGLTPSSGQCPCVSTSHAQDVLRRAILLNEAYKAGSSESTNRKRTVTLEDVEKYDTDTLAAVVQLLPQCLLHKRDLPLIKLFIELVLSFQNSADEYIGYHLAELYLRYPDLVRVALDSFQEAKRKEIDGELKHGWDMLRADLRQRCARMDSLNAFVGGTSADSAK